MQGFDLGDLPSNLDAIGLITPLRNLNHSLPLLEKASKSAIALFNKQNVCVFLFLFVFIVFFLANFSLLIFGGIIFVKL